ncbi:MAG TPA: MFS transporter [Acidimicrobiales bacterium]|nr:MFS transporter [Acidimicrobiales bacterium]
MAATDAEEAGAPERLTRRGEHLALVALTLPVLLISMDATILGFAVPHLSEALEPSSAELLWIVDTYSFVLSALLITMGNLGDRIGRRRLLLVGAGAFAAASVAAAFAPTSLTLIGARALLGVAGATLMPSTLSLIRNIFVDDRRRQFAISVWAMAFSVGAVVGPVVGGVLLERYWYGSVFLLSVPVTLALLLAGPVLVPESKDPTPGPFDIPSSLLSMATILPLVFGMKLVAEDGWSPLVLPALVVGALSGRAFARRQRRSASPMIDLDLFRVRDFRVAISGNLLVCVGFAGQSFLVTQYLQLVLDLSATRAALQLLPSAALGVITTLAAPAMMRRWGPFLVISSGLFVGAGGFLSLVFVATDSSLVPVTVALCLIQAGLCAAVTVAIDGIIASVPPAKAGAGASVSETGAELGVALGTAVLGSIMTAVYRSRLDGSGVAEEAKETLGAAHELGDAAVRALADAAFVDGLRVAAVVAAVLLAAVGVASARLVRGEERN